MPKQRQTCTRCSQRRQKCDRKSPCSRCVQNNEGHLCTTQWTNGYNPSIHRKYPRRSSPSLSWQSVAAHSSGTSSASPVNIQNIGQQQTTANGSNVSSSVRTPPSDQEQSGVGSTPAWPSKLQEITIGALLEEKNQNTSEGLISQGYQYVQTKGTNRDGAQIRSILSPAAEAAEIQHIQSLLPSKQQVTQIVDYYEKFMLYWIGGLYHGPTFRKQVLAAYGSSDTMRLRELDWRWTALLFSILSSGISGSSEASSVSWGFSIDDKVRLAREWGTATVSCLNLGNYTTNYHIYTVQAIYIMHAYEHLVGSSNRWVVLRNVAIVIAKALGLHRLGPHPDDERVHELSPEQKQAFVDREIGRRTWMTLACQDWLCSTSQKDYSVTIQKRDFTTARPRSVDEETMTPLDDTQASLPVVGTYFFEYASLLVDHYNSVAQNEEEDHASRYLRVLKFDGELRAACVERVPRCLSIRTPPDPSWPRWVPWARRLHQASLQHKIIMIHQGFLSKSFKDVRYTYSRWACTSAAQKIINMYNSREPDEPQWWVEQAFVVTSGICLVLDLFHRFEQEPETQEYLACVRKAVSFLQLFFTSSVATHGIKLLLSLLHEYYKVRGGSSSGNMAPGYTPPASILGINVTGTAQRMDQNPLPSDAEVPLSNDEAAQFNFDIDALGFEDMMEYLPSESTLDYGVFYDSLAHPAGWA